MNFVLTAASAAIENELVAPWWGRVLVGLLLIAIAVVLARMSSSGRIAFGDLNDWFEYLMVVLMIIGVCVVLWGLGVDFSFSS